VNFNNFSLVAWLSQWGNTAVSIGQTLSDCVVSSTPPQMGITWRSQTPERRKLSFIFVSVVFLSGCKSVQVFYCLFLSVLWLEIQLSEGEGWDPIYQFNPAIFLYLSQDFNPQVIVYFRVQWFPVSKKVASVG
jgi:hypothetical protein